MFRAHGTRVWLRNWSLEPGLTTEVEVARLERDEQAGLADLGLRLAEAKRLTAALQAEMVRAQVTVVGERRRSCEACGGVLASKTSCPFPAQGRAPGRGGKKVRPGLCPGPAKGTALGTSQFIGPPLCPGRLL